MATAVIKPKLTRLPISAAVSDAVTIAKRNLIRLRRTPQLVVFATIQPIMFILLFNYVFGGSIAIPGMSYTDYLIPGIIVQTSLFSGSAAAISMSEDKTNGIFDRFRSLPMARSAVLSGRIVADSLRAFFIISLMVVVGALIGFRFHNGFLGAAGAIGMCFLFALSFLWFFSFIGLWAKDSETAQVASFTPIFPFVFASSIFTQPENITIPWLQAFARNQPVTQVANSVRGLSQGASYTCTQQIAKATQDSELARALRSTGNAVVKSCSDLPAAISARLPHVESTTSFTIKAVLWMILIIGVFAPLAIRRYRRG